MKECELCDLPARMYCESDQASLCWDCDAKVHCANFLVARHLRNLLCHVCQSPTPWKASGSKLGPTVSICDRCFSRRDGRKGRTEEEESEGETDGRDESNEEEEEEEEEEDDDDDHDDGGGGGDGDGEEADGENQVVPWSSTPPPAASSSSSSGESSSGEACAETTMAVSLKRMRGNADLCFLEDLDSSSSHQHYNAESAAGAARRSAGDEATSSRPSKHRKKDPMPQPAQATGSRTALIGSIQRYQQDTRLSSDEDVLHICKLSRDPTAVDLVSTSNHSPPI
ncbi:zinc finger protein CONSTANS-LIKE 4-like [Magnolia sinica]|uniref:zinc finger protein CONSTANS-LIKE 4-like n=1 Tax=Magnolia sinica TaxID=86752 RepID=UPI002658378E|nr:zinc finger protein CONSTANS-LIKE 4-like [Magnolia sinica]